MFVSKNCVKELEIDISTTLGIKTTNSVGKFLEFPIFTKKPTLQDYQFIIDNLNQNLAGLENKIS